MQKLLSCKVEILLKLFIVLSYLDLDLVFEFPITSPFHTAHYSFMRND